MVIENVPIDELIPYERNAKKHPQSQIDKTAKSLQEFGWRQNLVIDANNVVVAGHGRLLAAKQLGMTEVPCVRADDLTEEQIKAYRLVDNRTAESEIDLSLEFDELQSLDMDLSDFGLEPFSIDDMKTVQGYSSANDSRDYFEKTFTFPISMKQKITNYLKKYYDDVINRIIEEAGKYGD